MKQDMSRKQPVGWLTRNWSTLRPLRVKRLGHFLLTRREQLGLSGREVEAASKDDHELISDSRLSTIERLSLVPTGEHIPFRDVDFFKAWWLTSFYGNPIAELEQYMLTGDIALIGTTDTARANGLRQLYLSLSPVGRQQLESFAQYLADEEAKQASAFTGAGRTGPVTPVTPGVTADQTPSDVDQAMARRAIASAETSEALADMERQIDERAARNQRAQEKA